MAQIPSTRGTPQASDVAVQNALPMVGSASREDLQTTLDLVDARLAKLFEDRNILLVGGGTIFFNGSTNVVSFTEALKLEINSKVAGGAPVVIDLTATSRTFSTDGAMLYAVINRTAGTAVVSADATSLPAVTSADQEVFLLAKRRDSGSAKTIYFRNGTVIEQDQSSSLDSTLAAGIDVETALPMVGTGVDASLTSALQNIDAELSKLYEDRNIQLTDGGLVTYLGTSVQFTQDLKLHINSKVAGGAPVIINLGATTRSVSADGRMIYAIINRIAGTAVVTDNAATLPAVTSANQEVMLIAKRADSPDGIKRLYFINGTALDEGQTVRLGASGSGSGTANSLTETMKNRFLEAPFELLTPYVISQDTDTLLDGASTATFSLISKTIKFDNIGDTLVTKNLLDTEEFLASTQPLSAVELMTFWTRGSIDTAATYQASRNGGNEWQTITMQRIGENTELYRGYLEFADESVNQTVSTFASLTGTTTLNATTSRIIGQKITLAKKSLLRRVTINLNRASSASVGNLFVQIVKDNAGFPSTALDGVLAESNAISISALATGNIALDVDLPDVTLTAGTYHIALRTDAAYKAGTLNLAWRNGTGSNGAIYNGTSWSASSVSYGHDLKGIELDLRVRVTSGTATKELDAIGVLYQKAVGQEVTGLLNREVFNFSGNTNQTQFTLTKFVPNSDFLKVYDINTGQVYVHGSFFLNGQTVVFENGQFLAPGQNLTLVFDQTQGGAFDNSDLNGLLLSSNHLGSTDNTIDKSLNGRGIFLRRPDGTLREIAIDNNDNIVVYSI